MSGTTKGGRGLRSHPAVLPLLCCFPMLILRVRALLTPMPVHDFLIYWCAGRLFIHGNDPYSSAALLILERSVGWSYSAPLVMFIPPWSLPFVSLLSIPPFQVAHYSWLIASIVLETACVITLWDYFGGRKDQRWIAVLVLATFMPSTMSEHMGQITPLVLVGLTAFLLLLRRRAFGWAGAFLILLGIKPHLLYLVVLTVLFWTIQERKWKLALTAFLVWVGSTVAVVAYDHKVLGYFGNTFTAAVEWSPTGIVLRSIFGAQRAWLQFLPMVIGAGWLAIYWRQHRHDWKWEDHLPTVLIVSVSTAPYFWAHDYILALPSLIALAVGIVRNRDWWFIAALMYGVLQYAILLAGIQSRTSMAITSLLWLPFYLIGRRYLSKQSFPLQRIEPA